MHILVLMLLAYAIYLGWRDHNDNNGGLMMKC